MHNQDLTLLNSSTLSYPQQNKLRKLYDIWHNIRTDYRGNSKPKESTKRFRAAMQFLKLVKDYEEANRAQPVTIEKTGRGKFWEDSHTYKIEFNPDTQREINNPQLFHPQPSSLRGAELPTETTPSTTTTTTTTQSTPNSVAHTPTLLSGTNSNTSAHQANRKSSTPPTVEKDFATLAKECSAKLTMDKKTYTKKLVKPNDNIKYLQLHNQLRSSFCQKYANGLNGGGMIELQLDLDQLLINYAPPSSSSVTLSRDFFDQCCNAGQNGLNQLLPDILEHLSKPKFENPEWADLNNYVLAIINLATTATNGQEIVTKVLEKFRDNLLNHDHNDCVLKAITFFINCRAYSTAATVLDRFNNQRNKEILHAEINQLFKNSLYRDNKYDEARGILDNFEPILKVKMRNASNEIIDQTPKVAINSLFLSMIKHKNYDQAKKILETFHSYIHQSAEYYLDQLVKENKFDEATAMLDVFDISQITRFTQKYGYTQEKDKSGQSSQFAVEIFKKFTTQMSINSLEIIIPRIVNSCIKSHAGESLHYIKNVFEILEILMLSNKEGINKDGFIEKLFVRLVHSCKSNKARAIAQEQLNNNKLVLDNQVIQFELLFHSYGSLIKAEWTDQVRERFNHDMDNFVHQFATDASNTTLLIKDLFDKSIGYQEASYGYYLLEILAKYREHFIGTLNKQILPLSGLILRSGDVTQNTKEEFILLILEKFKSELAAPNNNSKQLLDLLRYYNQYSCVVVLEYFLLSADGKKIAEFISKNVLKVGDNFAAPDMIALRIITGQAINELSSVECEQILTAMVDKCLKLTPINYLSSLSDAIYMLEYVGDKIDSGTLQQLLNKLTEHSYEMDADYQFTVVDKLSSFSFSTDTAIGKIMEITRQKLLFIHTYILRNNPAAQKNMFNDFEKIVLLNNNVKDLYNKCFELAKRENLKTDDSRCRGLVEILYAYCAELDENGTLHKHLLELIQLGQAQKDINFIVELLRQFQRNLHTQDHEDGVTIEESKDHIITEEPHCVIVGFKFLIEFGNYSETKEIFDIFKEKLIRQEQIITEYLVQCNKVEHSHDTHGIEKISIATDAIKKTLDVEDLALSANIYAQIANTLVDSCCQLTQPKNRVPYMTKKVNITNTFEILEKMEDKLAANVVQELWVKLVRGCSTFQTKTIAQEKLKENQLKLDADIIKREEFFLKYSNLPFKDTKIFADFEQEVTALIENSLNGEHNETKYRTLVANFYQECINYPHAGFKNNYLAKILVMFKDKFDKDTLNKHIDNLVESEYQKGENADNYKLLELFQTFKVELNDSYHIKNITKVISISLRRSCNYNMTKQLLELFKDNAEVNLQIKQEILNHLNLYIDGNNNTIGSETDNYREILLILTSFPDQFDQSQIEQIASKFIQIKNNASRNEAISSILNLYLPNLSLNICSKIALEFATKLNKTSNSVFLTDIRTAFVITENIHKANNLNLNIAYEVLKTLIKVATANRSDKDMLNLVTEKLNNNVFNLREDKLQDLTILLNA